MDSIQIDALREKLEALRMDFSAFEAQFEIVFDATKIDETDSEEEELIELRKENDALQELLLQKQDTLSQAVCAFLDWIDQPNTAMSADEVVFVTRTLRANVDYELANPAKPA